MAVSGGGVNSNPNVTPMIDVMLVLLIIFMITIPQINAGFQATPPQGQNLKPKPEEDSDQVLGIDADGRYWLNKSLIRNEDLEQLVSNIFTNRDDAILYVKAHKELSYDKVLEALDIVARGGVTVAALITEQTPGTESLVESDRIMPGSSGGN
ncbi:MAG TPA: biopolymer transporter ExbD [Arachnia sp.]|nr:biopolymer transporter ExbD [Arachnia sp.]